MQISFFLISFLPYIFSNKITIHAIWNFHVCILKGVYMCSLQLCRVHIAERGEIVYVMLFQRTHKRGVDLQIFRVENIFRTSFTCLGHTHPWRSIEKKKKVTVCRCVVYLAFMEIFISCRTGGFVYVLHSLQNI